MAQHKIRSIAGLVFGLLLVSTFSPIPALAQSDDPGLIGALGIDDPSISNSYYFETSFDNDFSRRHWIYFYGEGVFALGKDWGLVVQFPNLSTRHPLGQFPLALEPIGILARYEAWHFGGWNDETSGAFSLEAGGAYGIPNTAFPWIGSGWIVDALGGYRFGRFFAQADYGFQGALDPQVPNQWQLNTSLGYRLNNEWYLQVEADFTADSGAFNDVSWAYVPQVAFQPGDWLFEFGESFGGSSVFTDILVARAL